MPSPELQAVKLSVRGAHSGQTDYTLSIDHGGEHYGRLEFSVYQGKPAVQLVEVPVAHRRRGYGRRLVMALQEQYPDQEIDLGWMTADGQMLKNQLVFEEVPTDAAHLPSELDAASAERDRLLAAAEQLQSIRCRSVEQQQKLEAVVAPLNDLHDRIDDLTQRLAHEKPYKLLLR